MTEIKEYKLWALPSDANNVATAETYEYSYSNYDHILIVSPEQPIGSKEITEEHAHLLTHDDWTWLLLTSERIRREQEKILAQRQDEFLEKFAIGLEQLRKEGEQNGGEAQTE